MSLALRNLDLQQVAPTMNPDAGPMPGRLSGQFTAFGPVSQRDQVYGEGTLRLADSSLVGNQIVGFLYNAMRLNLSAAQRTGRGIGQLRLERGTVHIPAFRYFNQGVEVRASHKSEDRGSVDRQEGAERISACKGTGIV